MQRLASKACKKPSQEVRSLPITSPVLPFGPKRVHFCSWSKENTGALTMKPSLDLLLIQFDTLDFLKD